MLSHQLSLLALGLGATTALAQGARGGEGHVGGSFEEAGETQVSAMMMMVGNDAKVYILDKSEGNAAQINGHPAMGSVYDIATRSATVMQVTSNPFCASGMHMPNGSFITFGGNGAIGPTGAIGDTNNGQYDTSYGDFEGQTGVRVLNPLACSGSDAATKAECQWYDDYTVTHLKRMRWYSTAEPLATGEVAIIGGFTNGGYINRNYPNTNDPVWQGNASQPTVEFWPPRDEDPYVMDILVRAGGLNSYAHAFQLASGSMLVQANVSTVIWNPSTRQETPLPDMPENIVRVYPASGGVAMMPLTVANNWTQTVLFCGGTDMPDDAWGNYSWPFINTWEYPASKKCHQLTPEPHDGSAAAYVEDDSMLETRTMGQFVLLPNGQMLMLNGALNGTAGYATQTLVTTSYSDMPYGMSLASGPVGQPALYTPTAPKGQRWSNAGLATSSIPRLYHSTAILMPNGAVFVAGSNPNVDVNLTTVFPTTYKAEIFYPPYFSAPVRPAPTGVPKTISYGGNSFDITIPASSYSGSANDAAENTTVVLMRPGFTTHAMTMGQRYMQLNNTFTVNQDGSYVLHVAQAHPNPNVFQPGPAFLFVNVHGIPSNGTFVIVGNGELGQQPVSAASQLPPSTRLDSASGSGPKSNSTGSGSGSGSGNGSQNGASMSSTHTAAIVGGVIAAIAAVGILGALFGILITRWRRAASQRKMLTARSMYPSMAGASTNAGGIVSGRVNPGKNYVGARNSDSSAFVPLQQDNSRLSWQEGNPSVLSLTSPYYDGRDGGRSREFDPYYREALRY